MTREERRQIVTDALDRACEALRNTDGSDMGMPETRTLLQNICDMGWLVGANFTVPENAAPIPEAPTPVPTPAPTPAPAPVEPVGGISKEELREKLTTYSNAHDDLDVAAIMNGMGFSKLSEVPADRYAELLEKVETAVKGGA